MDPRLKAEDDELGSEDCVGRLKHFETESYATR